MLWELTKLHEEVIRTTLSDAVHLYDEKSPKGEFVLVIDGKADEAQSQITLEQAVEEARRLVDKGMSVSAAAKEIAAKSPFKKGDIYKELI